MVAARRRSRRRRAGGGAGRGRGRGGALAQLPDDKRVEAEQRLAEIDKQFPPPPRANVKDFVDHIDYITKKIGIDHVGISSDFDGGGGIDGWNDASETFNVTLELVRRGYTEDQIAKIWSGNLLRVMEEVRQVAVKEPDDALVKKARAIHERVITLDTHDDINVANFTPERNYTQDLDNQVNLPKMTDGGLDASFFIVYVGQGPLTPEGYDSAYQQAIEKFDAIHRADREDRARQDRAGADRRRRAADRKAGKKVALIGVENGYPLGDASTAIKRVKEFYDRGARYMSLAHNGHSQLSDSNTGEATGEWLHNGLSDLGKQVIAEMNRVGIMVDVSHPSKQSIMQAIALSKAPVIASHSAARALCNHSRNWTTSSCWR